MSKRAYFSDGYFVSFIICALTFFTATSHICFGPASTIWDADMQYLPHYSLLSDFIRQGSLLYWSPWTCAGTPLFVLPGVGVFSFPTLVLSWLFGPGESGYILYWLTLWFFGISGMLLLARHLGAPSWVGLVVALGHAYSGVMTGHAEHLDYLYGASFLPWGILSLDRVLLKPSAVRALVAGLCLGFLLVASYPGVGFGACLLYLIWCAARLGTSGLASKKTIVQLLIVAGAGLAIASPAFMAFLHETLGYTDRTQVLPKDLALASNPLTLPALLTVFSPYLANLTLFGSHAFLPTDVSGTSLYFGLVPLILVLFGMFSDSRDRFKWALLGGALFFYLLACSTQIPLRSLLYEVFPPSRFFRHSALFRIFAVFLFLVAAVLSGKNFKLPNPGVSQRSLFWFFFLAVASAISAFIFALQGLNARPPLILEALAHCFVGIAFVGVLFFLAIKKQWKPKTIGLAFISIAVLDCLASAHLTQFTVYTDGAANRNHWNSVNNQYVATLDVKAREGLTRVEGTWANYNLITKNQELNNYGPLRNIFFDRFLKEKALLPLALGAERIWFAPAAKPVSLSLETFDAYSKYVLKHGKIPLLISDLSAPTISTSTGEEAVLARIPFKLEQYQPSVLELVVDAPSDGWVLVTDRWARSWRAFVDGNEVPIHVGNFIFRAVQVKSGKQTLKFQYDVSWIHPYLFLSWLVTGCGFIALIWERLFTL